MSQIRMDYGNLDARRRSFDSAKTRLAFSTSNGRSINVCGSHSLRGTAKKSPP